ncbi:TraX family protein, partial [Klebsiella pneumoniae]|nr:TraX family protein [Klebsiella pneumoniae]
GGKNSLNRLIRLFAGKKSAQIREILISESAWEEMTCLFAPSLGYGVLWALMVLLMNMHNVSESAAGLAIALLTLIVCSSAGERVKRFWPRHFFVMFYAVHLAVLGIVISM